MIDKESVVDLIHDYGDTHGVYALELDALRSFASVADPVHLPYHTAPYESFDSEDPELFMIEIDE